jgi:nuclear transport factor 2 (NTF2) superfamily protein
MERKRIYIVAKTYPTVSGKYSELVCTAGVLEDGSWIRLYPVPFRMLDNDRRYPKFSWIELEIEKNPNDFRPESYRPVNLEDMVVHGEAERAKVDWVQRKEIIFRNQKIYTNFTELIGEAKTKKTSLAIFRPSRIIDFTHEQTDREWKERAMKMLKAKSSQPLLFQEMKQAFSIAQKIPYTFKYKYEDDSGKQSHMMVEDWEIGMLYLNCLKNAEGNEKTAIEKVKQKYLDEYSKKDIHFFLGTTLQFHNRSRNPFLIIGVFPLPKMSDAAQTSLF